MTMDEEEVKKWKVRRRNTSIAFAIQRFLLGMDYSVKCITLWIYIKTLMHLDHPRIYYALASFSYFASAIVFSAVISKIADKYRNIRTLFFVCNTCVIVGNVIYALPLSRWCLITGSLLSGIGFPLNAVITGELARSYKDDQLTFQLSLGGMFGNVGFLLAPGVNIGFSSINRWFGGWHITYANFPLLYSAALFVVSQVICATMISNLSKEYDLKAEREASNSDLNESSTSGGTPKVMTVFKAAITNPDTALLLIIAFFETFLLVSTDLWIPIMIIDVLKWPVNALNGIVLASGVTCIGPCVLLMRKKYTDKFLYSVGIVCLVMYALIQLIFFGISVYKSNTIFLIICWSFYCIFIAAATIVKDVIICSFLAKMVTSNVQSSIDSLRLSFSNVGSVLAMITAPFSFMKLEIITLVYLSILTLIILMTLKRRKTLTNPQVVISL